MFHEAQGISHKLKLYHHMRFAVILCINNIIVLNCVQQRSLLSFYVSMAFRFEAFSVCLQVILRIKFQRLFRMIEMRDHILQHLLRMILFVKFPQNIYIDIPQQIPLAQRKRTPYLI